MSISGPPGRGFRSDPVPECGASGHLVQAIIRPCGEVLGRAGPSLLAEANRPMERLTVRKIKGAMRVQSPQVTPRHPIPMARFLPSAKGRRGADRGSSLQTFLAGKPPRIELPLLDAKSSLEISDLGVGSLSEVDPTSESRRASSRKSPAPEAPDGSQSCSRFYWIKQNALIQHQIMVGQSCPT